MPLPLQAGNPFYYTDEFKTIVRSCKEILLNDAVFSPFVGDSVKFAYRYNFHKLLRQLGGETPTISEDLIWVTSYLNGIENPNQDFMHLKGIYTVSSSQLDAIVQVTRTRRE